jgi:hypothetical protein
MLLLTAVLALPVARLERAPRRAGVSAPLGPGAGARPAVEPDPAGAR